MKQKDLAEFAKSIRCPFIEVSAKTGEGIQTSISLILNEVLNHRKLKIFMSSSSLRTKKKEKETLHITVPMKLEESSGVLLRSDLCMPGILVSRYTETGGLILNNFQEKANLIANAAPILAATWSEPYYVTSNPHWLLF